MFKAWLKKYKVSIIVIFVCLLAIGGVITCAILGRDNSANSNPTQEEPTENAYTLMDLGGKGCVPCDNLQPILANLRVKYDGKISVLFYDIMRTPEGAAMANKYNVNVMPTLIFLENDIEVHRVIGFQSEDRLEELFRLLGWTQ